MEANDGAPLELTTSSHLTGRQERAKPCRLTTLNKQIIATHPQAVQSKLLY